MLETVMQPALCARPFEGEEQAFDRAGADTPLDVGGGDRLQAPAVLGMLVENLLQLVAVQRVTDQRLPETDDLVLVGVAVAHTCVPSGVLLHCPGPANHAARRATLAGGRARRPPQGRG